MCGSTKPYRTRQSSVRRLRSKLDLAYDFALGLQKAWASSRGLQDVMACRAVSRQVLLGGAAPQAWPFDCPTWTLLFQSFPLVNFLFKSSPRRAPANILKRNRCRSDLDTEEHIRVIDGEFGPNTKKATCFVQRPPASISQICLAEALVEFLMQQGELSRSFNTPNHKVTWGQERFRAA